MVVRSQRRGNEKRAEILKLLRRWFDKVDYPAPTLRDIADELHCSVATVHRHVHILAAQGLIEHHPGLSRTIRLSRRT